MIGVPFDGDRDFDRTSERARDAQRRTRMMMLLMMMLMFRSYGDNGGRGNLRGSRAAEAEAEAMRLEHDTLTGPLRSENPSRRLFSAHLSQRYVGDWYEGGEFTAPELPVTVRYSGGKKAKKASLGLGKGASGGGFSLQLTTEEASERYTTLYGAITIHDDASVHVVSIPVQGAIFHESGRASLFGNAPDGAAPVLRLPGGNGTEATELPLAGKKTLRAQSSSSGECEFNLELLSPPVSSAASVEPPKREVVMALEGALWSPNCGVAMGVALRAHIVDWAEVSERGNLFSLLCALCVLAQMYGLFHQAERVNDALATADKLSLMSFGHFAILDMYLAMLHFMLALAVPSLFLPFCALAGLKMLQFVLFDVRLLVAIWRARRSEEFAEGAAALPRELAILYSRFYLAMALGLVLLHLFFAEHGVLMMLLLYSFWAPQIIHNVHRDVRRPLDTRLLATSVLRAFPAIYFTSCSSTFVHSIVGEQVRPEPVMGAAIAMWLLAQAGILYLQHTRGPRFFVPASMLPPRYDYRRAYPLDEEAQGEEDVDCVICMCDIDAEALERRDYMYAPCDHVFHTDCLEQWMGHKMDCPTCRAPLPPP